MIVVVSVALVVIAGLSAVNFNRSHFVLVVTVSLVCLLVLLALAIGDLLLPPTLAFLFRTDRPLLAGRPLSQTIEQVETNVDHFVNTNREQTSFVLLV